MAIQTIDPTSLKVPELHGLLLTAVAPRPIAFASTVDEKGNVNLSPFSFFNVFSANPPIMIFSPARRGRDNTTKHTYENIKKTNEVVINIVNFPIVEQMSLASTEYGEGVNEFVKSGLTEVPSIKVKPPRVAESPVSFECEVTKVIELGDQGGAGNLILSKVVMIHVDDKYFGDGGKLDTKKLDLVARMGGSWYSRANEQALFEIPKPIFTKGIGVDSLPSHIKDSEILTGNNLGRLGNMERIPSREEIEDMKTNNDEVHYILNEVSKDKMHLALHKLIQEYINNDMDEEAFEGFICSLSEKIMAKEFASKADLGEKQITFEEIGGGCYAYTAEGDPNSGAIIGDDYVMIIEAQATPRMANDVIAKVRSVTDKPIKYLVLTHYHAVRVLGASAYNAEEIIMSQKTNEMVEERGAQDWASEFERFPRLFRGHESIPGLTHPTMIFEDKLTVDLGNKKVEIMHVGEGHTRGDSIVWVSDEKVMYAGDLVEYGATPYCGDAQLKNWPGTLQALSDMKPNAMVPGRGEALKTPLQCQEAILMTSDYVTMLFQQALLAVTRKETLKQCYDSLMKAMAPRFGDWVIFEHCMPFNVTRAYDEASGISHPRIWTDKRDVEMWNQLNS